MERRVATLAAAYVKVIGPLVGPQITLTREEMNVGYLADIKTSLVGSFVCFFYDPYKKNKYIHLICPAWGHSMYNDI